MAADFSPRSSSGYAWEFGFQGQFRDSETGWSNYGYRFYVPELGRWVNRDPIGERGGRNNYLMAGNNATGKLDILGLITDVDLEVLEHSRNPGGQGLFGAVYNQLRTIPPITIDSTRVGLVDGGASVGLLSELEKKACVCRTFEVDEVVFGVQTDHLWSIGRVNVKIVGTFTSTRKEGIDKWSFSGTFEPQNDSFDFEPLFDGRGTAAEIVNTAGWVAEKAGVFGTFEILFTGPVSVNWTRYLNCDE
jgi:RHS repeat-associated protein